MTKRFTIMAIFFALALSTMGSAVPGPQERDGGTVTGKYTQEAEGCTYQVQYRGDFGDTPYLNDGWIINNIVCDDGSAFNFLFVHATDPRYTGNDDLAIWGMWEWHVLTVSGHGNLANPMHPKHHLMFGSN
jgi:hypothetical protein